MERLTGRPVVALEDARRRVTLDVDLEPGTYVLACFIQAEDGTPHAFKGQAVQFEVTG